MFFNNSNAYLKVFVFAAVLLALAGMASAEIIVNIVSPADNTITNASSINLVFNFITNETGTTANCTLNINGQHDQRNYLTKNTQSSFTIIPENNYTWNITCVLNGAGFASNISDTRRLVVRRNASATPDEPSVWTPSEPPTPPAEQPAVPPTPAPVPTPVPQTQPVPAPQVQPDNTNALFITALVVMVVVAGIAGLVFFTKGKKKKHGM